MKILRVKGDTVYLYDLSQFILKHNIDEGWRFGISWKIKKKKKLRSYRIDRFRHWTCDDCGNITELTLTKGDQKYVMDNHFGSSHLSFYI